MQSNVDFLKDHLNSSPEGEMTEEPDMILHRCISKLAILEAVTTSDGGLDDKAIKEGIAFMAREVMDALEVVRRGGAL